MDRFSYPSPVVSTVIMEGSFLYQCRVVNRCPSVYMEDWGSVVTQSSYFWQRYIYSKRDRINDVMGDTMFINFFRVN